MAGWQRLGRAPRPLEVWHAFRVSIDMLILRVRRGQIIYDWQQFTRLWLSDYPVVGNTTIMVGGDAVHIRTQWTGGTEAEDITLTESGHLFESRCERRPPRRSSDWVHGLNRCHSGPRPHGYDGAAEFDSASRLIGREGAPKIFADRELALGLPCRYRRGYVPIRLFGLNSAEHFTAAQQQVRSSPVAPARAGADGRCETARRAGRPCCKDWARPLRPNQTALPSAPLPASW